MAETTEREKKEERSAGFTDGDYIPRNEAPKMPRVFSNADMVEPREPERRMMPVSLAVMFCVLFLFLGLWLGSGQSKNAIVRPSPLPTGAVGERAVGSATFTARSSEHTQDEDMADRPCLGIAVQTVTAAAAEYYRLYCNDAAVVGAQIYAVGEDSAARQAGLQPGDILTALDGEAVRSEAELYAAECRYRAGESAVCTLYRDGALLDVPVVFAERDPDNTEGLDW